MNKSILKNISVKSSSQNMGNRGIYSPDAHGYYGQFGGAYIPEMLFRNVEELRTKYLEIIHEFRIVTTT